MKITLAMEQATLEFRSNSMEVLPNLVKTILSAEWIAFIRDLPYDNLFEISSTKIRDIDRLLTYDWKNDVPIRQCVEWLKSVGFTTLSVTFQED